MTMVAGLDSAFPPSLAEAEAAFKAGVRVWGGYFEFRKDDHIYHGWSDADFRRVKSAGMSVIAYCSGWDDPHLCKERGARLGANVCLDVEGGIRGSGPWVPGWIAAAESGLYGNCPVHAGRRAAFHVLAGYPGFNPHATWGEGCPRPVSPLGWQWEGTHTEYGTSVDRGWFDPWFAQEEGDVLTQKDIWTIRSMIANNAAATLAGVQDRCNELPRPPANEEERRAGWDSAHAIITKVGDGGGAAEHLHDMVIDGVTIQTEGVHKP